MPARSSRRRSRGRISQRWLHALVLLLALIALWLLTPHAWAGVVA
ncbi:MAG TPA: hypothetical protein VJ743_08440 [Albitalea sp.]|nr:hypothetical protein [Albitalea sp.]